MPKHECVKKKPRPDVPAEALVCEEERALRIGRRITSDGREASVGGDSQNDEGIRVAVRHIQKIAGNVERDSVDGSAEGEGGAGNRSEGAVGADGEDGDVGRIVVADKQKSASVIDGQAST
ncbi:MAG: hypothetical protein PHG54_05145 [Smithellaceae bacterium]|nr:hypothetical protein [Syntrophaceae bacterium]MDD4240798.1 hypothetical protein [Smithellaceae bacterium]NLX51749.1 hypothetical protein [Deltaproteobacteria bacterium]